MAIADTEKIDFIGLSPIGVCILTVADDLDWRTPPQHLHTLQEKLNTYLRFIKTGEINNAYPSARGKAVQVMVALKFPPPPAGLEFLQEAKAHLQEAGIGLEWGFFPQPQ